MNWNHGLRNERNSGQGMERTILGDPGATSRDDAIFSARKFTSRAEELEVNFSPENIARPKISHRPG